MSHKNDNFIDSLRI